MVHEWHPSSITTTTTMPPSCSSSSSILKSSSPNQGSATSYCKHSSPSATTLDLLILILVLFSGTFLLTSYCSYLLTSLSLLLPSLSLSLSFSSLPSLSPSHLYYLAFSLSFISILTLCELCCLPRSRKCGKINCRGLKKCLEFDLQMLKEGTFRSSGGGGGRRKGDWSVEEIEELPWKGGTEGNPDYECLRAELRKIAPTNGKAVLLFRAKCGCPVAKLEGWGPKRGRRFKK